VQPLFDRPAPPGAGASGRLTHQRAGVHRLGGDRLDSGPGAVDGGGGQLLFALPKVVIQRAGFDARRLQDLIDPGCDIALTAEQGVAVGDRVVVPFQISCRTCRECRRGVTSSCGSVPLTAMCGLGPLAGLDGGGFMSDLVLVPYADAMLVPLPATVDPIAVARWSSADRRSGCMRPPCRGGKTRRRR